MEKRERLFFEEAARRTREFLEASQRFTDPDNRNYESDGKRKWSLLDEIMTMIETYNILEGTPSLYMSRKDNTVQALDGMETFEGTVEIHKGLLLYHKAELTREGYKQSGTCWDMVTGQDTQET